MPKSFNFDHLPLQDIFYAALVIIVMSTIIANVYNPLWGVTYSVGNIILLTFLGWLYKETWSDPSK